MFCIASLVMSKMESAESVYACCYTLTENCTISSQIYVQRRDGRQTCYMNKGVYLTCKT